MRVLQTYKFKLGTKIPYSEYPTIARRFLEEQNLVSHRFLYHFCQYIHLWNSTLEEVRDNGSCAKAVKDCPMLGPVRYFEDTHNAHSEFFLTNIDVDTPCTEMDILPRMNKIYRRYGFADSNIYYYDVNFFGKVIPFERDLTRAKDYAAYYEVPFDPVRFLSEQPCGSGLRLHRDRTGDAYIELSVDILHNGQVYDAGPYYEALKALLPKVRPLVQMEVYLSEEEKQRVADWNAQAAPVVEKCQHFFAERFPGKDRQLFEAKYSVSAKLKKLAKQYDFPMYYYDVFGAWFYSKRTPRGHILRVWLDTPSSHCHCWYRVEIEGIGFKHQLCDSMQTPTNQAECDECADKLFAIVAEFEKTLLPELDAFYDETPEWFAPTF